MESSTTSSSVPAGSESLKGISTLTITERAKSDKLKKILGQIRIEKAFKSSLVLISLTILVLVIGFLLTLIIQSIPSIKALGIGFLFGKTWDPVANVYGSYPFLLGTLLTSFTALIMSVPFSFALAIFLGEYYPRGWFSDFLKNYFEIQKFLS